MDKLGVFVLALTFFTYVIFDFGFIESFTDAQGQTRIINGDVASIANYPYAVSLQRLSSITEASKGHVCGGGLITLGHVLTTATCFYDLNSDGTYTKRLEAAYRIFAGAARLTDDTQDRIRNVQQFIPHPSFIAPPSHLHDIGVIALATRYVPIYGIVPLSLVNNYHPETETRCWMAGWGANTAANPPPNVELRQVQKYIFDQQLCTFIYTINNPNVLNLMSTMVCAATFDIMISSHVGDDGNILICGNNNVLTGVLTHYPSISGQSYPEVFTRVNNYTSWIRSVSSANIFAPGVSILLLASFLQVFSILS